MAFVRVSLKTPYIKDICKGRSNEEDKYMEFRPANVKVIFYGSLIFFAKNLQTLGCASSQPS